MVETLQVLTVKHTRRWREGPVSTHTHAGSSASSPDHHTATLVLDLVPTCDFVAEEAVRRFRIR